MGNGSSHCIGSFIDTSNEPMNHVDRLVGTDISGYMPAPAIRDYKIVPTALTRAIG